MIYDVKEHEVFDLFQEIFFLLFFCSFPPSPLLHQRTPAGSVLEGGDSSMRYLPFDINGEGGSPYTPLEHCVSGAITHRNLILITFYKISLY